jgi:hypothetical protein
MIERLLVLYTADRFTRVLLYAVTLLLSVMYGVINSMILNRSIEQVSREIVIFTAIIGAGLPMLYSITRPKTVGIASLSGLRVPGRRLPLPAEPGNYPYVAGSIALAESQRNAIYEELVRLSHYFMAEYAYRHPEDHPREIRRPFVIEHEYQTGKALSLGAWGGLVLGVLAQWFTFHAVLSTSVRVSAILSLGGAVSEFALLRGVIALLAESPRKPSHLLSTIAGASAGISLLLVTGIVIIRSAPYVPEAVTATVLSLLSFALPFTAGVVSAAAQPFLWSHRLAALVDKKEREAQRLEYNVHMLRAFETDVVKQSSERRASVDI